MDSSQVLMTCQRDDYDYIMKVILIGDLDVGKSQIVERWCFNRYEPDYKKTIGVDFKLKLAVVKGKQLKIHFWDTSGDDKYQMLVSSYLYGSLGILCVFDISNQNSFQKIQSYLPLIKQYCDERIPVFLIGNQTDKNRMIPRATAQEFASLNRMNYMEVSAQNNQMLDSLFLSLGELLVKQVDESSK